MGFILMETSLIHWEAFNYQNGLDSLFKKPKVEPGFIDMGDYEFRDGDDQIPRNKKFMVREEEKLNSLQKKLK